MSGGDRGARDAIRACLPHLPTGSLEVLGEGDFCRAYRVESGAGAGRSGVVVRVPKHHEARAALVREACLLPTVAPALPVAVPAPRIVGSGDGAYVVAVHEALPGTELWRDRWADLPEGDRRRLAGDVGVFLRRLHDLGPDPGAECGVAEADHAEFAATQARRLAMDPGPVPAGLRRPLQRRLEELQRGDPTVEPQALLHGDFGPGHTLFDPDTAQITGVIDWGDAIIGDRARDFIFVYEDWGAGFLTLALEAYGPEDPGRFARRVHLHYLADQLEWVLDHAADADGTNGLAEGVEGLAAALEAVDAAH